MRIRSVSSAAPAPRMGPISPSSSPARAVCPSLVGIAVPFGCGGCWPTCCGHLLPRPSAPRTALFLGPALSISSSDRGHVLMEVGAIRRDLASSSWLPRPRRHIAWDQRRHRRHCRHGGAPLHHRALWRHGDLSCLSLTGGRALVAAYLSLSTQQRRRAGDHASCSSCVMALTTDLIACTRPRRFIARPGRLAHPHRAIEAYLRGSSCFFIPGSSQSPARHDLRTLPLPALRWWRSGGRSSRCQRRQVLAHWRRSWVFSLRDPWPGDRPQSRGSTKSSASIGLVMGALKPSAYTLTRMAWSRRGCRDASLDDGARAGCARTKRSG